MDERLFRRLKVHAAAQGANTGAAIEHAVQAHSFLRESSTEERMAAFGRLTSDPPRLWDGHFRNDSLILACALRIGADCSPEAPPVRAWGERP
jgi:hypothetical protein